MPRSDRSRTILALLGVSLLLVGLLAAGVFWSLSRRVDALGEHIAQEALTLSSARRPRPSHVDVPTPGSLAQALKPLLPELLRSFQAEARLSESVKQNCREVGDGQRPVSELAPECGNPLVRDRALIRRTLQASRTEEAGLPLEMQLLELSVTPYAQSGLAALQRIVRLAALDVRLQVSEEHPDDALGECLDALALARDMAHGGGLMGTMMSTHGHEVLFIPCLDALQRASPSAVRQATLALRRIREGLSPFSSAMNEERILEVIRNLGEVLGDGQRAALPERVRLPVNKHAASSRGIYAPRSPTLLRHALLQFHRYHQQLVPLMDLPLAARTLQLEKAQRPLRDSWNWYLSQEVSTFEQFAVRADLQRIQLDLLQALAWVKTYRTEHGEWPSALPTPAPGPAVLLPTPLQLQAGTEGTLVIRPSEDLLRDLEADSRRHSSQSPPLEVTARP